MKTDETPAETPVLPAKRVTEQLNAVYRRRSDSALDKGLEALQFLSLPDDEWEVRVSPTRPAKNPKRPRRAPIN